MMWEFLTLIVIKLHFNNILKIIFLGCEFSFLTKLSEGDGKIYNEK